MDPENAQANQNTIQNEMVGEIIQRDGWVSVVRENRGLKGDMERMSSRVRELEEEFVKMKEEMKKVSKSYSSLSSTRLVAWKIGCKLLPRSSDAQRDVASIGELKPRPSGEQVQPSRHLRHRKSFSLFH